MAKRPATKSPGIIHLIDICEAYYTDELLPESFRKQLLAAIIALDLRDLLVLADMLSRTRA